MNITEYPTAIVIMNSSNDTMVGKVFFEEPEKVKIPRYSEFTFIDNKDREDYKIDPSAFFTEIYSQKDELNFGSLFLNLPEADEILDYIGANLHDFKK